MSTNVRCVEIKGRQNVGSAEPSVGPTIVPRLDRVVKSKSSRPRIHLKKHQQPDKAPPPQQQRVVDHDRARERIQKNRNALLRTRAAGRQGQQILSTHPQHERVYTHHLSKTLGIASFSEAPRGAARRKPPQKPCTTCLHTKSSDTTSWRNGSPLWATGSSRKTYVTVQNRERV